MVTAPMEYEPSPSNTGVQDVPLFSVRHTPPEATPTKYRARFLGSTASEEIRPETNAGPDRAQLQTGKRFRRQWIFRLVVLRLFGSVGLLFVFRGSCGNFLL